jgi:DNA-binding transcriptional regulator YdaS (Cro superfamily)
MQALAIDSLADTATHISKEQILEEIKASEKLAFYEYFASGVDPIKQFTLDDIKLQMNSMDYEKAKAVKIIETDIYTIDFPADRFLAVNEPINFNNLVNSNVKGDADRAARINSAIHQKKSAQELSKDQRIQYLVHCD